MTSSSFIEQLENRRLLSLTIDLRLPGGGKEITANHIGQVVNLEAWVAVSGSNADLTDDGLQIIIGSFLSSNTGIGSVRGDLSATRVIPFNANGSTDPAQADLDGDGDLDAGSNNDVDATGFFAARSASVTTNGAASSLGGVEFKIANVSFTVTSLLGGTSTQLNFRPRGRNTAVWREDGITRSSFFDPPTGTIAAGTPVVVHSTGVATAGSISGTVFNDVNQSGTRNPGEAELPGWTVFLDSDRDGVMDPGEISTVTDSNGDYTLSDLAGGTYHVAQVLQSGYGQIDPSSAEHDFTLAAGENRRFVDFADSTSSQIRGTVYRDENKNGKLDAGDSVQAGWFVYLDANHNGRRDDGETFVASDAKGLYTFKLLSPGQYDVRAQPGSDAYSPTSPASRIVNIPGAGTIVQNRDFGFALAPPPPPPSARISGIVYDDLNANGTRDSGEPTLSNWRVYLDANRNALPDSAETSLLTDAVGAYNFTALPAGSYRVREFLYAGYRRVTPSSGFYDVTLSSTSSATARNFGNTKLAFIKGTVFGDTNGNTRRDSDEIGLSGWRVFDDGNGNGKLDTGEVSALTDSIGNYTLNVSAGWHIVRVQSKAGYKLATPLYYKILVGESTRVYNKLFGETPLA